jgi:DNA-binding transcriptional MerR regulator
VELTIGELARRAGVAASTIRYWERIGLLPEPSRLHGRRRYAVDTLEALRLIRLGKEVGFTLGELRALRVLLAPGRGGRSGDWRAALQKKRLDVAQRLRLLVRSDELLAAALGCGCTDLRACLSARFRRSP